MQGISGLSDRRLLKLKGADRVGLDYEANVGHGITSP